MSNNTNKVRHVVFRDGAFSGVLVKGTLRVDHQNTQRHMERAFWLTTQLESSKWGTVQSYDGAGMSAGPLHNTAILPRTATQGSLWRLLRYLEISAYSGASAGLQRLWEAFRSVNWFVNREGMLSHYDRGGIVSAHEIRNVLSPPNGQVPRRGQDWDKAKQWALLFHEALSHPHTFHAQREFAIEYLITGRNAEEKVSYSPQIDYGHAKVGFGEFDIPMEADLAMCVYHSHSVNAPGPAMAALRSTNTKAPMRKDQRLFAKVLLWSLGTTSYQRWKDDKMRRNRYDSTRIKAMGSGLWPQELFVGTTAIMPENLPATEPKR